MYSSELVLHCLRSTFLSHDNQIRPRVCLNIHFLASRTYHTRSCQMVCFRPLSSIGAAGENRTRNTSD